MKTHGNLLVRVSPPEISKILGLSLLISLALCAPVRAQTTTTGFSNLMRPEAPGTLLSHPSANGSLNIGRTTTVQYLRGWLYVGGEIPGSRSGSDLQGRVYRIEDPKNPVRMFPSNFGLTYANNSWNNGNYGFNAHGSAVTGGVMWPTTWKASADGGMGHAGFQVPVWGGSFSHGQPSGLSNFFGGHNRSAQASPWFAAMQWYGSPDSDFVIRKRVGNQTKTLATFDHNGQFGGGEWHPMFFGDLLIYARSSGSDRDGIVIYRLAYNNFDDPATMSVTPQFVASMDARFQGYWPVLYGDGSGLFVLNVAGGVVMVADITGVADPNGSGVISKLPEHVTPINHATYPVFQDQFAFIHNKKFDMAKLIVGDPNPVALTLDEVANKLNTSQMSLPLGNLWLTGGSHRSNADQGMGVWVQQQAPDTTRPRVSYHIPQSGRTNYPRHAPLSFLIHEVSRNGGPIPGQDFLVRKVGANNSLGSSVDGFAIFDMSGVLTFTPHQGLDADSTYQVNFIANTSNGQGFRDAAGNYIEPYSFRFSTGSGVAGSAPPTVNEVTSTSYISQPNGSFTVSVNATVTGSAVYRYNFNGTWSAWTSSKTASHSFSGEGRYRVLVEVRDGSGFITTGTVNILVKTPPTGPFPTNSSTVAMGTDGTNRHVWTVNPDSDTVTVSRADTGAKVREFPVGKRPRNIARDHNGRYWVTCEGSDEIWILSFNPSGNTVAAHQILQLSYGTAPFGVAPSPNGQLMYVSLHNAAKVARFNVDTPSTVAFADTPPTPRAIAVSGNGQRIFVTRFISPSTRGEVEELESIGTSFVRKRTITLFFGANVDGGDRADGVPNYLSSIVISPDGQHAIVASKQDNTMRGELYGTPDLTFETTTRAIASVISLTSNSEIREARRDFDNADSPSAIAFTPLGDSVFITLQGNNELVSFDTMNLGAPVNVSAHLRAKIGTGLAPQGVVVDPQSNRIFVQNFMSRSLTVLDAAPLLVTNRTSLPEIAKTPTVSNELLGSQILRGKQIFYNAADTRMSADSYISCATCHFDGGHDGRLWDLTGRGEGLRRTTDLRGRAGLGQGNVHWSGNFDEIQDFEHDIRGPFGGTGFLPLSATEFAQQHPTPAGVKAGLSSDLDALAAYVTSLKAEKVPRSPHRNGDGSMTAAALNGKSVFNSMNCASCHSGSGFTNSQVNNITSVPLSNVGSTVSEISGKRLGGGLLTGVDTPTLWGLHTSENYLHHGLANSLDEVFDFAGGTYYPATDAAEIWTYKDVVDVQVANSIYRRNFIGGGVVRIRSDEQTVNGSTIFHHTGTGIRYINVDGGSGGVAEISIRHSVSGGSSEAIVRVNGTNNIVALPQISPDFGWQTSHFRWSRVQVTLSAGTNNTIEVLKNNSREIYLNGIFVSTSNVISAAQAHRQVKSLSSTSRNNLLTYLRSLDGRDDNGDLPVENVLAGLRSRWTFDSNANDTAPEGTANNGTFENGASVSTGGSLLLTGSNNQRVQVANHSDLNPTEAITFSAWINSSDLANWRRIFQKGGNGAQYRMEVNSNRGGKFALRTGGTAQELIIPNGTFTNNRWYFIAATYDGSQMRVFVDGNSVASLAASGLIGVSTDALFIGGLNSTSGNHWKGSIGDLRIYNRALESSELHLIYEAAPSFTTPPSLLWSDTYFTEAEWNDPAIGGWTGDADGDGVSNLLEYASGQNPRQPGSSSPAPAINPATQRLTLTFQRIGDPRLRYEVLASNDLVSWDPNVLWTSTGTQNVAGAVTVEDAVTGNPRRFLRLRVTLLP